MRWRAVGSGGRLGKECSWSSNEEPYPEGWLKSLKRYGNEVIYGYANEQNVPIVSNEESLKKALYIIHLHPEGVITPEGSEWMIKHMADFSPQKAIKEVKKPRKQFECDFESLNEDGSLRIKVAPFDPDVAWKATKLAAGDGSD
jgi:hypothetical protein